MLIQLLDLNQPGLFFLFLRLEMSAVYSNYFLCLFMRKYNFPKCLMFCLVIIYFLCFLNFKDGLLYSHHNSLLSIFGCKFLCWLKEYGVTLLLEEVREYIFLVFNLLEAEDSGVILVECILYPRESLLKRNILCMTKALRCDWVRIGIQYASARVLNDRTEKPLTICRDLTYW